MYHRCERYPGKESIEAYLSGLLQDFDPEEFIAFKQWVHTDRDTVKSSKDNLKMNELLRLLDFAENYSFVVRDAVQGFQWENSQAIMHPFVVYYKRNDQKLGSISFCIISDCLKNDTVTVHTFLSKLIPLLKIKFPELKNIEYFSDGSAVQCKNFKNFINLCITVIFRSMQSGIFLQPVMVSGKSPCDGIGSTAKRLAANASLQRPLDNQTATDLFKFCSTNISGIEFLFVSKSDIESARPMLENMFSS